MWREYFKEPFSYDEEYFLYWLTDGCVFMSRLSKDRELFVKAYRVVFCDDQPDGAVYEISREDPTVILRNGEEFLRVRGWGYLVGWHCMLDVGTAMDVQNSFLRYCVEKLNNKESDD